MSTKPKKRTASGGGADTTIEFLVVLPAEQIKTLKIMALEKGRGVTASSLLARALSAWLKRHRSASNAPFQAFDAKDKRQFLSKFDAKTVNETKDLARDWKVTASAIVSQAVSDWLRDQGREG